MNDAGTTATRWRGRTLAALAVSVAGLLATACSQTPISQGADAGAAAGGPRGSRVSGAQPGSRPLTAGDARVPVLAKLDGMIIEWDEAQATGDVDRARTLEQQLRYEVDANDATLQQAARGDQGLAAQYLAVSALGFSSSPQSTRSLVDVLPSRDAELVGNALIALKLRADPETPLGPVMAHIQKRSPTGPRRYAPLALATVLEARARVGRTSEGGTTATAVSRLSVLVNDIDPIVRLHVARALGVIRTPGTVPPLQELVGDDHARVQWAAAAALARTGDMRGFPAVLRLMHGTPEESRHLIRDILVSYARSMQNQPLTDSQLAQLGTGVSAWSQWFSDFKRSRGILPNSREESALGG